MASWRCAIPSTWGNEETRYFYEITPERILDAVEATGLRCTGRCLPLNSMENRVYEVELEVEDPQALASPSEKFRIVKFYRPGRWSRDQIHEEHQFLKDLLAAEVPGVGPIPFSTGDTLHRLPNIDIWYAVFPKIGGRSPDELIGDQLDQIGRLLARLHAVGATRKAPNRVRIGPQTYGIENLRYLIDTKRVPPDIRGRYQAAVEAICRISSPWFESAESQRIHGDCHLGNLLQGREGFFFVDFDDMVQGPCVQDVWLLVPGRDEESLRDRERLLEAYEQMRPFPRETLRLVEPLRALRFVHFSAWIAKRWEDPAFPRVFEQFGTPRYWEEQLRDIEEQLRLVQTFGMESTH